MVIVTLIKDNVRLANIIREIPELEGRIFTEVYIMHKTQISIAKELGISISYVRRHLGRAVRKISEQGGCTMQNWMHPRFLPPLNFKIEPENVVLEQTNRYRQLNLKISGTELNEALSEMPKLSANVFKLYYLENKRLKDIVCELNIPLCRVTSQRTKAHAFIRRKFGIDIWGLRK